MKDNKLTEEEIMLKPEEQERIFDELLSEYCHRRYTENKSGHQTVQELMRIFTVMRNPQCLHENEIMRQGNGFIYTVCKDCGKDLNPYT